MDVQSASHNRVYRETGESKVGCYDFEMYNSNNCDRIVQLLEEKPDGRSPHAPPLPTNIPPTASIIYTNGGVQTPHGYYVPYHFDAGMTRAPVNVITHHLPVAPPEYSEQAEDRR